MEDFSANKSMQEDEIYALSAIFESDWILEDEANKVYSITLYNSTKQSFYLQVIFPPTYPSSSPPTYSISAPWLTRQAKAFLISKLEDIYCENLGTSIVFLWIEAIKEFIQDGVKTDNDLKQITCEPKCFDQNSVPELADQDAVKPESVSDPNPGAKSKENTYPEIVIKHGSTITDKKSVFQAHVATVNVLNQTQQFLEKLKENRKIATATHNIMAYRIFIGDNVYHDCDDDGEDRAGANLLRLLEILDARNVIVVVTRWYGGIHLGPARFKHINNVARELLVSEGFVKQKSAKETKS